MRYAQTHCSIEHDPQEHTYTYKGKCIITGKAHQITVNVADVAKYNLGALIQNAFPYLSVDDREFLKTGIGPGQFEDVCNGNAIIPEDILKEWEDEIAEQN